MLSQVRGGAIDVITLGDVLLNNMVFLLRLAQAVDSGDELALLLFTWLA